jgi:hypothetical protein
VCKDTERGYVQRRGEGACNDMQMGRVQREVDTLSH